MGTPDSDRFKRLSRPQHERILTLVRLIRDRRFPNSTTFMRELEVDRRTILRDLDYLRDRMGLPIEYHPGERGYYLSKPVDAMPLLELREADLLWLFVGQHLLGQAANGELANRIRESFQRISGLLGSTVQVGWEELSTLMSSKTSGLGAAESRTFQTVSQGLARHVEIRFDYSKTGRAPFERRQVRPIHCAFVNGQWYLYAHDITRKATRAFVLSRMSRAAVTGKRFDPTSLPSPESLTKRGFGVSHSSRKPVRVKIRVSAGIAHLIGERQWHPTQKIRTEPTGDLMLEMETNTFRELTNWICSWGPRMEVISPPRLRKAVAGALWEAAAVYRA